MNRKAKRLCSLFVMLTLVVTTLVGDVPFSKQMKSVKASIETEGTICIHFRRPSKWKETPRIYSYVKESEKSDSKPLAYLSSSKTETEDDAFKTRYEMSYEGKESDGSMWYSYQLPKVSASVGVTYVIFTNGSDSGSGNQYPVSKADESAKCKPTAETWYYLNSSFEMSQKKPTFSATATPSVTATPKVTATPVVSDEIGTEVIVFYKRSASSSWTDAYIHYKFSETDNKSDTWTTTAPGVKMEKVSAGYWKYTISNPKKEKIWVIFNNGNDTWDKNTGDVKYQITKGGSVEIDSTNSGKITVVATAAPAATATVKPSATPVVTATAKPSATPSTTPVTTATVKPSASVSPTPSITPTATVQPTQSPVVSPEPTATISVPETAAPTATPTVAPTAQVDDGNLPNEDTTATIGGSISFSKTNRTVGEKIKVKVNPTNLKAGTEYTYVYCANSTVFESDTNKKVVEWAPTKAGTYKITVMIFDDGNPVASIETKYKVGARVITIKSAKTSKKSGQKKNSKIKLTVKASSKKGALQYKFTAKPAGGTEKTIRDYKNASTATWVPKKKGSYTLYVYVKNSKGNMIKKKISTFKIK